MNRNYWGLILKKIWCSGNHMMTNMKMSIFLSMYIILLNIWALQNDFIANICVLLSLHKSLSNYIFLASKHTLTIFTCNAKMYKIINSYRLYTSKSNDYEYINLHETTELRR